MISLCYKWQLFSNFLKKDEKKIVFFKKNPKNQPKSSKKVKNLKNLKICKKTCFWPQNDFFLKFNLIFNVFLQKKSKNTFFLEKMTKIVFGTKKSQKSVFLKKNDQKSDFLKKKAWYNLYYKENSYIFIILCKFSLKMRSLSRFYDFFKFIEFYIEKS